VSGACAAACRASRFRASQRSPRSRPGIRPTLWTRWNATRLAERLHALDRALGDLPAQALRFARWRARRRRVLAAGRRHRSSPLRPGRAYGILRKGSVRPPHLVDEVLRDVHFFAVEEIGRLDTS